MLAAAVLPLAGVPPLRIEGLVTAVFTPFDAEGTLQTDVIPQQQAWLNSTGVHWVFTTGTTGESLSLSVSERKRVFDAWVATGTNVIAHVGAESLQDAHELAAYAESGGAKAVAAMSPTFFKPATASALAHTIASVCAAAPKLPCYYYHIPSMTGVDLDMLEFVQAIEPLSANFAGVKYTGMYTHPGMMGAQRVLEYKDGKYEVLCGREEMMLEALAIGIRGHVGSQFNLAGDLFNELIRRFDAEGITRRSQAGLRALQSTALALISAWDVAPPGGNGNKFFMNEAGVPVGDARLPSVPLADADKTTLRASFAHFCATDGGKRLKLCARSA